MAKAKYLGLGAKSRVEFFSGAQGTTQTSVLMLLLNEPWVYTHLYCGREGCVGYSLVSWHCCVPDVDVHLVRQRNLAFRLRVVQGSSLRNWKGLVPSAWKPHGYFGSEAESGAAHGSHPVVVLLVCNACHCCPLSMAAHSGDDERLCSRLVRKRCCHAAETFRGVKGGLSKTRTMTMI